MTLPNATTCPHCGESVQCDPSLAGVTGKCPSCGKQFQMPETEMVLLKQIRDNTAFIRFWIYPIFALLVIVLAFILLPWIRLPWGR